MSELLSKEFIFIWAGIVSLSFIIWILLTAKELNDIVDNAIKTTDSPGSTSQVNFFAQTFPNFFDQTNQKINEK